MAPGNNTCDLCVTPLLQRSKPSVMSEENQMPAEGVNDCSATNSTHFVVVERVCADSGEKLSAEKNSCYVRACVFILANVLMC